MFIKHFIKIFCLNKQYIIQHIKSFINILKTMKWQTIIYFVLNFLPLVIYLKCLLY